jgi:hypothetical protein
MDINHEEEGITSLSPLILQQVYATCVKLAVSHRDDSSLGIPELKMDDHQPHVLIWPFPAQGQIKPMVGLTALLCDAGSTSPSSTPTTTTAASPTYNRSLLTSQPSTWNPSPMACPPITLELSSFFQS